MGVRQPFEARSSFFSSDTRIFLFAILVTVLASILAVVGLHRFRELSDRQRRAQLKEKVSMAHRVLQPVLDELKTGKINPDDARAAALRFMQPLVYDDEFGRNNVFLHGMDGTVLFRPWAPKDEGQRLQTFPDENGTSHLQEVVQRLNEHPEGIFVSYWLLNPRSRQKEEKLSFIQGLPELGVFIGNGNYVSETQRAQNRLLVYGGLSILILLGLFSLPMIVSLRNHRVHNHRMATEIRERLKAEEELRRSKAILNAVLNSAPVGIASLKDHRFTEVNETFARIFQRDRSEFLGQSALTSDLFVTGLGSAENPLLGGPYPAEATEVRVQRADGSVAPLLMRTAPLELDGARDEIVTIALDVTAQKEAEEALSISEEKFSKIFYLSPDAILISRLEDGVILDANDNFMAITGYAREEVIGKSSFPGHLNIWADQSDRDHLMTLLKDHGEAIGFEARFRRKDGQLLTGLLSLKLLDINGERRLLSMTRDISERKQAEEHLRETAQRLELATSAGKLGIWDRNLLTGELIWDDQMFVVHGLDRTTFHPSYETWCERIHPDDLPGVKETLQSATAGKRLIDMEFRVMRGDGSIRHLKSNGIVIRNADGQAVRMTGITRDRTEQHDVALEHQRLQTELQHAEKLESIGSLAGGIAHDMNNVLAAVLMMTSLLREKFADGDATAKGLDIVLNAGNRGKDLVKALTDFARKDLEEQGPIDVNTLLRMEMDLLRRTTLQKVNLELSLEKSLPLILGDVSALGNAIMNLSINALDAMPQGGTLRFHSRTLPGGKVEIEVADTGSGMPPDVLAKALDPFFTTKPVGKGTGLGLARVYGTVKAHKGTLEIQSKPNEGTSVFLRIPAMSSNQSENANGHHEVAVAKSSAPKRILVVDDDPIILETLPPMLASMGHVPSTAVSGLEALRQLGDGAPIELVILDQNMPGLTGVETLANLRTTHAELPVVLSSGYLDRETEAVLKGAPQVWVLKKPYSKRDLHGLLLEVFLVDS